jgi:hypothetical protein
MVISQPHTTITEDQHRHLLAAEPVARVKLTGLPSGQQQHVGARRQAGEADGTQDVVELEAPFGRKLALHFNAFGQDYHAELTLHDALFEAGAVTHTDDEHGSAAVRAPRAYAYTGRFLDGGWIRATVHDAETVHAMWLDKTNGRVSMLVPVSLYEGSAPHVARDAASRGGRMLAFHLEDMASISHDPHDRALLEKWLGPHVFGRPPREAAPRPMEAMAMAEGSSTAGMGHRGRATQSLAGSVIQNAVLNTSAPYGLMFGCPSTMYKAAIGVAVDAGYFKVRKGLGLAVDGWTPRDRSIDRSIHSRSNHQPNRSMDRQSAVGGYNLI